MAGHNGVLLFGQATIQRPSLPVIRSPLPRPCA